MTTTTSLTRTYNGTTIPEPGTYTLDPSHTAVEHVDDERWKVTGDLTVKDVTRPVTLDVDFEGANSSPMGDQRVAFSASTDVDREDWGLTWNVALETGGLLVGKSARIELAVQAIATSKAAVA